MKKYVIFLALLGSVFLNASAHDDIVRECKEKEMHGCYELGNYFLRRGDPQQAIRYHKMACDNHYFKSCIKLGVMYEYGKGRKKNISKAAKYYKDVCKKGEGSGCMMLGELMMHSQMGSTSKSIGLF